MKLFEEYLEEGVVKRQSPDEARARALIKESRIADTILRDLIKLRGVTDENANHIIKNAYDSIMELVRAAMLKAGYGATGRGAHAAEVAYLAELGFDATEIEFADRLRYYRNGILYYGKSFDADYARRVLDFLEKVRERVGI